MDSYLFVGLGNPGQRYVGTRHNLGFMAIDSLAESSAWKSECRAVTQRVRIAGKDVLLAKPQTYMNLSGESVQALMSFYKVKPENLLVFSDDVNLACGKMRIRPSGSAGGQNGLKSIIEHIGQNFARVRIGAGLVPEHWDLVNWVLSSISKEDMPLCEEAIKKVKELCEVYLTNGVEKAQNLFN
ncbi:MAG: aminoacyl-tRNA hydrolase [Fibromonadaceae bacterium]|jgi:PTH1 family peptidyl-tRNA hydrolase|nr:aminoacyl-tRNA hydrolase [Fibromonadaceae bacterium]